VKPKPPGKHRATSTGGATGKVTLNPDTLFTQSHAIGTDAFRLSQQLRRQPGIAPRPRITPGTDKIGSLFAISAETGKTLCRYDQRAAIGSLVATGSGLIFAGDANGHFRAFDQRDPAVLWDVNLGSPIDIYPVTHSARGKQYVAVSDLKLSNANNIFVFALPE
jgi:outer membrane protein assembly factor BamB